MTPPRGRVRRTETGSWAWVLPAAQTGGLAATWREACEDLAAAQTRETIAAAELERARIVLRGPITPGDPRVPRGNRRWRLGRG